MRCERCKSLNVVKFVDGFGERRTFCKCCGRSFLQDSFTHSGNQMSLAEFDSKAYYRPQALRYKVGVRY
jgi:hypothetical protein